MAASKTRTVPALYNALKIIELLAESKHGLSLADLTQMCGLSKSTVHYLLVTLERCGYVRKDSRGGRYMAGIKLLAVANAALHNLALRQRTAPYLFSLRLKTGLGVHLAIYEHQEAMVIAKLDSSERRLASWVGKRMDLHCTGIGKAIMAYLSEEEREDVIKRYGLARKNDNTLCNRRRLQADLDQVVRLQYALDNEEDELGMRCIGVPIIGPDTRPVAAVSISGSVSQLTPERIPALAAEVKTTAHSIREAILESMQDTMLPEILAEAEALRPN
ncbi:MAG: IclR family transcriptional regulator [Acidobacteriota bacterium]